MNKQTPAFLLSSCSAPFLHRAASGFSVLQTGSKKIAALAVAGLLAVTVAGCSSTGNTVETANGVKLIQSQVFGGVKKVTVPQYNISFATLDYKTAAISTDSGSEIRTLGLAVKGLNQSLMQRITDDAYADFEQKLQASGYKLTQLDASTLSSEARTELELVSKAGMRKNQSHYQDFGNVSDITVPRSGTSAVQPANQYLFGAFAEQTRSKALTANFLLHVGRLTDTASMGEDVLVNKMFEQTGVTFEENAQVYWYSGVEMWESTSESGSLKLEEVISSPGDIGSPTEIDASRFPVRVNKALLFSLDEDKFYQQAMAVMKQANSKLVEAMLEQR